MKKIIKLSKVLIKKDAISEVDIHLERRQLIWAWKKALFGKLFVSVILLLLSLSHVLFLQKLTKTFKKYCPFYMRQKPLEMEVTESAHKTCKVQNIVISAVAFLMVLFVILILTCAGLFDNITKQLFFIDKNHINVAGLFVSTYIINIQQSWGFKLLLIYYYNFYSVLVFQLLISSCMVVMNLNFWPGLIIFCRLIPGNYTVNKFLTSDAYHPYENLLEQKLIMEFKSCEDPLFNHTAYSLVAVAVVSIIMAIQMIFQVKLVYMTDRFIENFSKLIHGFDGKAKSLRDKYIRQAFEDKEFIEQCKNLQKFNAQNPFI